MRTELERLNYKFSNPFEILDIFEKKLANFFASPYCVLVDSCTHGIELCLRINYDYKNSITIPLHTYMSIPMMLDKLDIVYNFSNTTWNRYYKLSPTNIYDAATLWEPNSYLPNTMMVISFQYKKHIKIGKGGAILLDDEQQYNRLRKLRYDGRDLSKLHHEDQITEIGYHYYMTPEDAALGIMLFDKHSNEDSKTWSNADYRPLTEYSVFNNIKVNDDILS